MAPSHSRSCVHSLLALVVLAVTARTQVGVAWDSVPATGQIGAEGCLRLPDGGFLIHGASYAQSPDFPAPTFFPVAPYAMRLDAAGQVVHTQFFGPGSTNPWTVLAGVDALGRSVLGFPTSNALLLRGQAADGMPTYSAFLGGLAGFARGGLRCLPGGDVVVVARTSANGLVTTRRDSNGAQVHWTVVMSSGVGAAVCAISDSGRVAVSDGSMLHIVEPAGGLGWSAPLAFVPDEIAFGPAGEVALAGPAVLVGPSVPIVRVHEADGSVRFTRSEPQTADAAWRALAFDRFGFVAVAGAVGTGDASDGLVALYAPDGTPRFARTWNGTANSADTFEHVLVSQSGEVHVSGATYLTSTTPYWTAQPRLVVAAFDRAGGERWQHVVASSGTDTVRAVGLLESQDARVVAVGNRLVQTFVSPNFRPDGVQLLALAPQSRGLCYGDVVSAICPCGNAGPLGEQRGCANSSGNAARLADSGIASLSNDTLVLAVDGTTPNAPGLYFQGNLAQSPTAFGDGLRCAGGTLRRLYTKQSQLGASSVPAPSDLAISARTAAAGDVLTPGSTRVYQVSYRDVNAAFCPAPTGANQNASNALAVTWGT